MHAKILRQVICRNFVLKILAEIEIDICIPKVCFLCIIIVSARRLGIFIFSGLLDPFVGPLSIKGFIDEIPKEYEEAAMVDGYSRWQAFYKIVLPQATTGIAATTVFAMIFTWNEYAFALLMTSENARTAPPAIATMLGRGGVEWSAIAAGTLAFLIPVIIVAFALRRHLLRGVTFGAIRQ